MHDILLIASFLGSLVGPIVVATLPFGPPGIGRRLPRLMVVVLSCVCLGLGTYLHASHIPAGGLDTDVGPQDAVGLGILNVFVAVVLNAIFGMAVMASKIVMTAIVRIVSRSTSGRTKPTGRRER